MAQMLKPGRMATLLRRCMAFFFSHLYTSIARLYDMVAWLSSMGQWRTWQRTVLPALPDGPTLEIGHGTGHMLHELAVGRVDLFGIDPSAQMGRITRRRLSRTVSQPGLARASAQRLPFPSRSFQVVFSTFPSEYILDPATCAEAWRVLQEGGKFVIIPGIIKIGGSLGWLSPIALLDRMASWLYRLTGQVEDVASTRQTPLERTLQEAGFIVHRGIVQLKRATVLRIICIKQSVD